MMSVDILPTALPLEASQHFSNVLTPYLKVLVDEYRSSGSLPSDTPDCFQKALDRATVARNGRLTPPQEWLEKPLNVWRAGLATGNVAANSPDAASTNNSAAMNGIRKKKVLLLGSGLVSKPTVDELCKRVDVQLVIGLFEH